MTKAQTLGGTKREGEDRDTGNDNGGTGLSLDLAWRGGVESEVRTRKILFPAGKGLEGRLLY